MFIIRVDVVLGQKGDTVQWSSNLALSPLLVHCCGDGESIGIDLADGMQIRVCLLHAREIAFD